MTQKKTHTARLANTFGGFGYLSLCFQWLWVGAALLPSLLENESIRTFLIPDPGQPAITSQPLESTFSPILLLLSVIITVVVVLVSAIILIRLPVAIAKTGKKTVQSTAEAIIPVVTHHHKLPAKKRRVLTAKIVKYIKFTLCILPILLLLIFISLATGQISNELLIFIEAILTIGSLLWFSLQYLTARLQKVATENLF